MRQFCFKDGWKMNRSGAKCETDVAEKYTGGCFLVFADLYHAPEQAKLEKC
jgi:hypothetical protein